jgi:thioredoxin 1
VRTPKEYDLGHLQGAKNFDWNETSFETQILTLDKTKPIFVYCLSGGRSSSAADKLLSEGFKQVFDLEGGIMKWRGQNLPEVKSDLEGKSIGMTRAHFDSLVTSDKLVLVDFYADWCGPCRKMKPYLEEIAKEMESKVIVVRINADENQALCKDLKIDALPVLMLYKNKMLTWSNVGYLSKEEIEAQIK